MEGGEASSSGTEAALPPQAATPRPPPPPAAAGAAAAGDKKDAVPPAVREVPKFKVLLVGDGCVGKSSFLKRLRTGEHDSKYAPTLGLEVHKLRFESDKGPLDCEVWDVAGQAIFGGLRKGYYENVNAAIIMFDLSFRNTYVNAATTWYKEIPRVPTCLVGNKADAAKMNARDIKFHQNLDMDYYGISVKSKQNIVKPFLSLLRKLTNEPGLEILSTPYSRIVGDRRYAVLLCLSRLQKQHLHAQGGVLSSPPVLVASSSSSSASALPSKQLEAAPTPPPTSSSCSSPPSSPPRHPGAAEDERGVAVISVCPAHKNVNFLCAECRAAVGATAEAVGSGKAVVADETKRKEWEEKKRRKDLRLLEGELAFNIITSDDIWREILEFV